MSTDLADRSRNQAPLVRHALNGPTMGTRYSAVFFAPESFNTDALAAALFAAVDRVDQQMSTWKVDSDLNRLNAAPVGAWFVIPRELAAGWRRRSESEKRRTACSTFASATWFRPGASAPARRPSTQSGSRHLPRRRTPSPQKSLSWMKSRRRARKHAPVSLDLSGIAKGYGVDEMARAMEKYAIPSWLVGIDGEMRAKGLKPDGSPWVVALERPKSGTRAAMGVIELTDTAVATSGNYRHRVKMNGRTLSHTIDPTTGAPLENNLASVSVLATTCMDADAWATVLMILGEKAGRNAADTLGMDAIFVRQDGSVSSTF